MSDLLIRRINRAAEVRKRPHYDWMHPSWRDLIIDHLSEHPKVRKEFLEKCSVNGIVLALSGGGGTQGRRELPLLNSASDWEALTAAIVRHIKANHSKEVQSVLLALQETVQRYQDTDEGIHEPLKIPLFSLIASTLHIVRETWNDQQAIIPLESLDTYRQLSERLEPIPPMPQLRRTWDQYWKLASSELDITGEEIDISTYYLKQWIALVDCIAKSEPRFLSLVKFPACCSAEIEKFIEGTTLRLELDRDLDEEEDFDDEINSLDEMKVIGKLSGVCPAYKEKAEILEMDVRNQLKRVENKRDELFPEEDGPDYGSDHSGGIGVEEIFSDL